MDGDICPTENFLCEGEAETKAYREGLAALLGRVAEQGLQGLPPALSHEANKAEKVLEFIKGPLRLFYFRGQHGHIVVCTSGTRKSGKKADKASVNKAAQWRRQYEAAVLNHTLEILDDHEAE